MKRAPNWLKRPCGATFGFGGKLVAHGATIKGGAPVSPSGISVISVKSESTAGVVVKEDSADFEEAIKSGNPEQMIEFCETKKRRAVGDDQEAWAFMSILFANNARQEMLRHLEFGDALEAREKSLAEMSLNDGGDASEDTATSGPTSPALPPVEDNDAFFDNLGDEAGADPAAETGESEDDPVAEEAQRSQGAATDGRGL